MASRCYSDSPATSAQRQDELFLPAYGADAGFNADARNQSIHELVIALRRKDLGYDGRLIGGVFGGDALNRHASVRFTTATMIQLLEK
jgi:hypothetical protein